MNSEMGYCPEKCEDHISLSSIACTSNEDLSFIESFHGNHGNTSAQ